MNIKPHHFAAFQYSTIAVFLLASWWILLSPYETAAGQLKYIFAPSYENRGFFIFFALTAITIPILAIIFWLPSSRFKPFSAWMVFVATAFFVIAILLFDSSLILGFGLGCIFAIWSYFMPNKPVL